MDLITRTSSRAVALVILFIGLYIIVHGHLSPGGSFPGGVIIASVLALTAVVFGIDKAEKLIGKKTAHKIEALTALVLCTMVIRSWSKTPCCVNEDLTCSSSTTK